MMNAEGLLCMFLSKYPAHLYSLLVIGNLVMQASTLLPDE
jgi:hypothetical protein